MQVDDIRPAYAAVTVIEKALARYKKERDRLLRHDERSADTFSLRRCRRKMRKNNELIRERNRVVPRNTPERKVGLARAISKLGYCSRSKASRADTRRAGPC